MLSYTKPMIVDFGTIAQHTFALAGKPVTIQLDDGLLEDRNNVSP
jgi:hypothetical protein